jgi:hypothetical protein
MSKWQFRIQNWLGVFGIIQSIDELRAQSINLQRDITELRRMKDQISIHNRALGRFIAKLDPLFGSNEFDPARKTESDRLADAVIERLKAEHLASRNPNDE